MTAISESAPHSLSKELLRTLEQHIPANCQRLVVALSGGLDSMVLLEACHRLMTQSHHSTTSVVAIHINHQLQPQAVAWQEHCQQQCQQRGIALLDHAVDIDTTTGSLEDSARQQRYRLFRQEAKPGDYFLTGHHQDDQIETIMMRWLRAASRWGIAPQRALTGNANYASASTIAIGRPFLTFSRQQLEHIATDWQLDYVEDPSNQDASYERNWWRHQGIPLLQQRYADLTQKLQQTWRRQQSQLQLLDELLSPHYQTVIEAISWPNTLSTALICEPLLAGSNDRALALLQRWLGDIEGLRIQHAGARDFAADTWSHGELFHFIGQLRSTAADQSFAWQRRWGQLVVWHGRVYAVLADERIPQPLVIPDQESMAASRHWQWSFNSRNPWPTVIDCDQNKPLHHLTIMAALQAPVKKIQPNNRPRKTFKALFQEAGIPPWLRQHWPVIVNANQEIIALLGIAEQTNYAVDIELAGWDSRYFETH